MGTDAGEPQAPPRPLVAAGIVVLLEALALLAAAVVLIVKTISGSPDDLGRALFAAAFAVLGAVVLAFGARGLLRLRAAARTPIVVVQLLAVPVSYSLAFQADRPGYGGPILLAALVVLYLLFTPPVRAVLDRDPSR
jgi:hypothetical protein